MTEPKTCSTCRHWFKMPPPPAQRGPALLTGQAQPEMGQCREGPPHLTILPNGVQVSDYPPVSAGFPACGHYAPVLANGERVPPKGGISTAPPKDKR